jgi:methylated-DNA-protein-cysteine methyltransferase related protein
MMQPFTEEAIKIMKNIPNGKIMTYGQIARLAGSPRGARQVVRILHSLSQKYNLPWHRVINSKGEVSFKSEEQIFLLKSEGIEVSKDGFINLEKYLYQPDIQRETKLTR